VRRRVLGRAEQLNKQPDAHGDAQEEAKQVTGIVVGCQEGRALWQADTYCHRNQNKDECRPQGQGRNAQA